MEWDADGRAVGQIPRRVDEARALRGGIDGPCVDGDVDGVQGVGLTGGQAQDGGFAALM